MGKVGRLYSLKYWYRFVLAEGVQNETEKRVAVAISTWWGWGAPAKAAEAEKTLAFAQKFESPQKRAFFV